MKSFKIIYIICFEGKESYSEKNFFKGLTLKISKVKNYKELIKEKLGILNFKVFSVKLIKNAKKNKVESILKIIRHDIEKAKSHYINDSLVTIEFVVGFLIDRDVIEKEELAVDQLNAIKVLLKNFRETTEIKDFLWLLYPPKFNFEFLPVCCYNSSEVKKIGGINEFLESKNINIDKDIKNCNSNFLGKLSFSAEKVLLNLRDNLRYFEEKTMNCSCQCPIKTVPLTKLIRIVSFLEFFDFE